MSLYNMLFGTNRFAPLLLELLGTSADQVPRFRDCYLNDAGEIVIHTRTGGGNRDYYESEESCRANYPEYFTGDEQPSGPWNDTLRALPGFLGDDDDDFDCTYADFRFAMPEVAKDMLEELKQLGAVQNPAERWQELLHKMQSGDQNDPAAQRAMSVGKKVFDQINALPDGGTVEV